MGSFAARPTGGGRTRPGVSPQEAIELELEIAPYEPPSPYMEGWWEGIQHQADRYREEQDEVVEFEKWLID